MNAYKEGGLALILEAVSKSLQFFNPVPDQYSTWDSRTFLPSAGTALNTDNMSLRTC